MPIDEYTGLWYDDGSDSYEDYQGSSFGAEDPMGFNSNQFLSPMMAPTYSTNKWNFGAELPMGQPQINAQLTGATSLMKLRNDPRTMYEAMVATGVPTMDLDQIGGYDMYGNPVASLGGGGGGDGGGGGGGNWVPHTPYLDSLRDAKDDESQAVYKMVMGGSSPVEIENTIAQGLKEKGMDDPNGDMVHRWSDLIGKAFDEKSTNELGAQKQMMQGPGQTPIQEWMNKYGMIDPTKQYTPDDLPPDVDWMTGAKEMMDAGDREHDYQVGRQNRYLDADKGGGGIMSMLKGIGGFGGADQNQAVKPTTGAVKLIEPTNLNTGNTGPGVNLGGRVTGTSSDTYGRTAQTRPNPVNEGRGYTVDVRRGDEGRRQQQQQRGGGGGGWGASRFISNTPRRRVYSDGGDDRTNRYGRPRVIDNRYHAEAAARVAQGSVDMARREADDYRKLIARDLQGQGRTPARDAQRAVLNYLRSGGLGI